MAKGLHSMNERGSTMGKVKAVINFLMASCHAAIALLFQNNIKNSFRKKKSYFFMRAAPIPK